MATAIGYLRVSTDRQAEDGNGLEVQEAQVRAWASAQGHQLVAVYRDERVSGTTDAASRPGLASALAALEGNAEILVAAKLDRLARKLTVQEAALGQAWKAGARVFACDLGEILQDDPDDPMRTALRQMVAVFAELERAMITARMRAGRRHLAAGGRYAGYGSPRYGQAAVDRKLVTDPAEAAAIGRMVQLRADGLTLRQIAERLNAENVPAKRGGTWHAETVRRVLARLQPPPPLSA